MRVGIDVSQVQYQGTGVANYLLPLIAKLVEDEHHSYVLFYASLRKKPPAKLLDLASRNNVLLQHVPLPSSAMNLLWNKLHIIPIEQFIGEVDIFISSDWTQPPVRVAKNATILYDLIVYKYPEETDVSIVQTQRRRLRWVKEECDLVLCISEATKKDAIEILKLPEEKLRVVYPGI
ncbi:MAG: glycosyltransferase [bacterium]|nr:glycosyltransferase [bacterium]